MLRKTLLGVSSLALLTLAACAQEEADDYSANENETERMAETQPVTPETTTEPETISPETQTTAATDAQILDASQVGTKEEAERFAASEFEQADINRDGSIDKNEFLAYAVIRAPIEDPQETSDAPVAAGESDMAAGESDMTAEGQSDVAAAEEPADAEEQFAEISNGDDTISESEMVETRVSQFEEADANGDDELDPEERKEFAKLASLKPSSGTSL